MSDAVWYYAQGDAEHGPVTAAQLRALAENGNLKPSDLVWKEGMDDWKPANDVRGLFGGDSPSPAPTPPASAPTAPAQPAASAPVGSATAMPAMSSEPRQPRRAGGEWKFEPLNYGRLVGQPLLIVGLLFVLTSRGCDSIGNRSAAKANAEAQLMRSQAREAESGSTEAEALSKRADNLEQAARDARYNNAISGYWREYLFMLGTIILALGLLSTGFSAEGAAKWICLIMLAIITFSIYIGGIAWLGSVTNSLPLR